MICVPKETILGFNGGSDSKESAVMQETWVRSLGREDPLEKEMAPTPGFLPGELYGPRSLGYVVLGGKELDMTEQIIYIGNVN